MRGSSRQTGRHGDQSELNARVRDRDVNPVGPPPGWIAAIKRVRGESSRGRVCECRLAPAQAVQPVHAQALGLGFQMVGQAHRTVELAAEPGDRLQPQLGRNLEPIEDRSTLQRNALRTTR
jgi:hypothetical protein